jgi:hypothetical protein
MNDEKELPTPDDLGEGPEARMTNFPKPKRQQDERPPAPDKPRGADAVGEEDAQELTDMDEGDVRNREKNTQGDNSRVEKKPKTIAPGKRPTEVNSEEP